MKFTWRGNTPRSRRNKSQPSSIVRTMRENGTTATCVSGSRLVVAGVVSPDNNINVPFSASAQNTPVMPSLSSAWLGRASIVSPEPAQFRAANSAQHTPVAGSWLAFKYDASACGTPSSDSTSLTVDIIAMQRSLKCGTGSQAMVGNGPRLRSSSFFRMAILRPAVSPASRPLASRIRLRIFSRALIERSDCDVHKVREMFFLVEQEDLDRRSIRIQDLAV